MNFPRGGKGAFKYLFKMKVRKYYAVNKQSEKEASGFDEAGCERFLAAIRGEND